jgi:hypothetical protein
MIVPRERDAVPPMAVEHDKVLLTEGDTPTHFFEALAKALGLADSIEIRNYGGITQLGTFLKTLASTAGFRARVKSLGIVRDAEDNAHSAQQSVNSAVTTAKLSASVSVKVAILPDGAAPGMIETLCLHSVALEPEYECANAFFALLKERGVLLPDTIKHCKRVARVYLAGKDYPEDPVGIAAYKNVWPFDHTAFEKLKSFLQSL